MTAREAITQYVTFRQAAGADFRATAKLLDAFCRTIGPDIEIGTIPAARVQTFLDGQGPLTRYWHRKHSALRGLYRFALSRGFVDRVPLPSVIPKRPPPFVPYVFTRDEVRRLLEATDHYRSAQYHLEPQTFRALLLLLYAAALRLSEALQLTLADVDLSAALLTIRDTKFYKTRLTPLGPDLCRALQRYADHRQRDQVPQHADSPFLIGRTGRCLLGSTVRKAFAQLRRYAGIRRSDGARYPPRLHDLRHAFVGHRLMTWYRTGANVQQLLPQLSTFLGHTSVGATQVYLTMTPDLLREACRRFERYADLEDDYAR